MRFLNSVVLLILCFSSLWSQDLIKATHLKTLDKAYFYSQVNLQVSFEVDLYRVEYTTKNTEGALDTASGLVCFPLKSGSVFPMLNYMHGTVGSRYEVPSFGSFEQILPAIYSAFGFIATCPDYLGLGVNDGVHPYIHAASEAWVGVDLLKAAEQLADQKNISHSHQLFSCGYSQGGHASMAYHHLIQNEYPAYSLDAAAHMSGPYSIGNAMKELLLSSEEYGSVAYAVNIAVGLNVVYHFIPNDDMSVFFRPEFVNDINEFIEEKIDLWTLNERLIATLKLNYGGSYPKELLLPEVATRILNDDNDAINVALRDNDVYDWKPNGPTRLLYCMGDEQVSYNNSIIAEAKMKENGASDVLAINVNTNASHTDCVNPAVTNSLFFFLSKQVIGTTSTEDERYTNVSIYPNPVQQILTLSSTNFDGLNYNIFDFTGKICGNGIINDQKINVNDLRPGSFLLLVTTPNGQWHQSFVKM